MNKNELIELVIGCLECHDMLQQGGDNATEAFYLSGRGISRVMENTLKEYIGFPPVPPMSFPAYKKQVDRLCTVMDIIEKHRVNSNTDALDLFERLDIPVDRYIDYLPDSPASGKRLVFTLIKGKDATNE